MGSALVCVGLLLGVGPKFEPLIHLAEWVKKIHSTISSHSRQACQRLRRRRGRVARVDRVDGRAAGDRRQNRLGRVEHGALRGERREGASRPGRWPRRRPAAAAGVASPPSSCCSASRAIALALQRGPRAVGGTHAGGRRRGRRDVRRRGGAERCLRPASGVALFRRGDVVPARARLLPRHRRRAGQASEPLRRLATSP